MMEAALAKDHATSLGVTALACEAGALLAEASALHDPALARAMVREAEGLLARVAGSGDSKLVGVLRLAMARCAVVAEKGVNGASTSEIRGEDQGDAGGGAGRGRGEGREGEGEGEGNGEGEANLMRRAKEWAELAGLAFERVECLVDAGEAYSLAALVS